jgi:sec-independent protein translocase protein TatC
MRKGKKPVDADDIFADTRMSFGDHLEELRTHLLRAIYGFGIALVVSFFYGHWVLHFIAKPVEDELEVYYEQRAQKNTEELASDEDLNQGKQLTVEVDPMVWRQQLGIPEPERPAGAGPEAERIQVPMWLKPLDVDKVVGKAFRLVQKPPRLAAMSVTEGLMVWIKVCMVCGFVVASPWVFWQIWSFVGAGLYPNEKKLVNYYLPFSLLLFFAGVILCQFVVIPRAVRYLLGFNEWLGLTPDLRLNEWLSFAIWTPVIFGIAFQTPMVMLLLAKLGIFTSETYSSKRKYAWFIIIVLAALLAPSPDPLTYCSLWIPMVALYELGIVLAKYTKKPEPWEFGVSEEEEMVEV